MPVLSRTGKACAQKKPTPKERQTATLPAGSDDFPGYVDWMEVARRKREAGSVAPPRH